MVFVGVDGPHRIGHWYRLDLAKPGDGDLHLLAQVDENRIAFIGLDGNRWVKPVKVRNIGAITLAEFSEAAGYANPVRQGVLKAA